MTSLITPALAAALDPFIGNVFDTYKRALTVYIEASIASISTNPNYSRFGQHDQQVFNPAVNPQATVISGCLLYGNQQPWEYVEPNTRTAYQQDKLRESFGTLRLKVDATGYALLMNMKLINVDGFNFKPITNARPHSLIGSPSRYTFVLQKVD